MSKADVSAAMDVANSENHRAAPVSSHVVGRPRFKRAVFDFLNSGAGSKVSAAVIDLHFFLWKLRHPGAKFSGYYAGSIAAQLKRGGTHKTLGNKQFLSGSIVAAPTKLDRISHQTRGVNYFETAIAQGLRPEHTCIDYGCGSLRVGQHLISYLNPGHYWGLDIVSDFYEAGKTMLEPGLLERKCPQLHVIRPDTLMAMRQAEPDFIVSFAVLKHVPPSELDAYFCNIAALMAPHTKAIITFNEAIRTVRTGAKIWDYCRDEIVASVRSQHKGLKCAIIVLNGKPDNHALPRTSVISIQHE